MVSSSWSDEMGGFALVNGTVCLQGSGGSEYLIWGKSAFGPVKSGFLFGMRHKPETFTLPFFLEDSNDETLSVVKGNEKQLFMRILFRMHLKYQKAVDPKIL